MGSSNSDLTRRWFDEVWNKGRDAAIDEMLANDSIVHGLDGTPGGRPAKESFREFWTAVRAGLSDIHMDVDEVVAAGNSTAARFTFTANHSGPYLGAAATGKQVRSTGMAFLHWRDGKIIEGWNEHDALGLTIQTGAIRHLVNV
ncbi:MAG TPA: ester cyclase [Tepidisphaeraceae bacterium]|jgi:predicted ester cyclase|nr:ester cyclase [Tepidisphaeraceae bacterium]